MKIKPYNKEDFTWIGWGPKTIKEMVQKVLEEKKEIYKKIKDVKAEDRNFKNTVYALEASDNSLNSTLNRLQLIMSVSVNENVRSAAKEAIDLASEALVDIEYDADIYKAIREFEAKNIQLEGEDKKLFKDMLKDYRRMGFDLLPEKREELKTALKRIEVLKTDFEKNINDYDDGIWVAKEELKGFSENYISMLKKNEIGQYRVSLKYPEFNPFMQNADNAAKRKELEDKRLQKGGKKNIEILVELLALRQKRATLLNYPNYAAFALEIRMAKTTEKVRGFLNGLSEKLQSGLDREMEEILKLKKELTGKNDAKIEYYDTAYYSEKSRQQKFKIETEKIREYFPLQTVLRGMFEIYEKLFSLKFEKLDGISLWHKDAEAYAVKENGKEIGYFILDLYPRENKYGHAAMFPSGGARIKDYGSDEYLAPLAALVANFPKPTAQHPSLLSHEEVRTLFHEFGHIMHGVLTRAKYRSHSGTNVVLDFVEAPSQMLENWIWDKDMIDKFSGHYLDTNKKIPKEIKENLIRSRYHMISYSTRRQLIFGLFDFQIHTEVVLDIAKTYNEIVERLVGLVLPKESIFPAGFGHLTNYAAGYYSYLWAEVYAADMFSRFEKEGLLNENTGTDYKRKILEKGSGAEEIDLVGGFLGREPSNEEFLKQIGL